MIKDNSMESDTKLHEDCRDILAIQTSLDYLNLLLNEGYNLGTRLYDGW